MNNRLHIKDVVTIFTSLCTILSLFYIVAPDIARVDFVVYYFIFSLVFFLVLVYFRFAKALSRLDKGQKDGRSFWIILSAVFSLSSIALYFFDRNNANKWGLSLIAIGLVFFLLALGILFYFWLSKFVHSYETESFIVKSADFTLTRYPNRKYDYEVIKNIESRLPILTSVDCGFKWSGDPVTNISCISSSLQNVGELHTNVQDFDRVDLLLKAPMYYKQDGALHMKMTELTDVNNKANQHLSYVVKEGTIVDYVKFNAILLDATLTRGCVAILEKRALSSNSNTYVDTKERVSFDPQTKSYKYILWKPEPGYDYRLSWKN